MSSTIETPKLTYSIPEVCEALQISRTTLWKLLIPVPSLIFCSAPGDGKCRLEYPASCAAGNCHTAIARLVWSGTRYSRNQDGASEPEALDDLRLRTRLASKRREPVIDNECLYKPCSFDLPRDVAVWRRLMLSEGTGINN